MVSELFATNLTLLTWGTVKRKDEHKPSHTFDYLVKSGVDEQVALEIDEYAQRKDKKRKRRESKKEERWK